MGEMKREVEAGVNFLKCLALAQGKLDKAKAEVFAEKLQKLLCTKYDEHWYPEQPSKGQAYRCIRLNNGVPCDEVLLQACAESELTPSQLSLPCEVTIWIDPLDVCARSGENSRPFTVASFSNTSQQDAKERQEVKSDSGVSDHHSATSSDCGSVASSDTEEEAKEAESHPRTSDTTNIAMMPRIRKRYDVTPNKVKYAQNMPPANLQYFYQPPHVWPRYKKAPLFLTPGCAPSPPPPPQHVFGYYFLPSQPPPPPPPPHFLIPKMPMQVWGAVKG